MSTNDIIKKIVFDNLTEVINQEPLTFSKKRFLVWLTRNVKSVYSNQPDLINKSLLKIQ